nr:leucyl aminopeptidase family protein [Pseudaminobacter sp.]
MTLDLVQARPKQSRPVYLVAAGGLESAGLQPAAIAWAASNGFTGEAGKTLLLPDVGGQVAGALFGTGDGSGGALAVGALARALPEGDWHFSSAPDNPSLSALGLVLGGYAFTRYG